MTIIQNKNYWGLNIERAEEKYDAKYIGDFSIKSRGYFHERPVSVFYQKNPDRASGHSNYFGLLIQNGNLCICNAESAFSEPITGLKIKDGTILVSGYPHDYVSHGEGYFIDGGRSGYIRTGGNGELVKLAIIEDKLYELSPEQIEKNLQLMEQEY